MRACAEVLGSSVFCYGDQELTHRWLGVDAFKGSTDLNLSSKKQVKSQRIISGVCWL